MSKRIIFLFILTLLVGRFCTVAFAERTVTALGVWTGAERDAFMKMLEPYKA